jgi:hypothetical protein
MCLRVQGKTLENKGRLRKEASGNEGSNMGLTPPKALSVTALCPWEGSGQNFPVADHSQLAVSFTFTAHIGFTFVSYLDADVDVFTSLLLTTAHPSPAPVNFTYIDQL